MVGVNELGIELDVVEGIAGITIGSDRDIFTEVIIAVIEITDGIIPEEGVRYGRISFGNIQGGCVAVRENDAINCNVLARCLHIDLIKGFWIRDAE